MHINYKPPRFVCRRCGRVIPRGENGSELRSLAIYCADCAAKMLETRERHARDAARASVRTVRVKRYSYKTPEGTRVDVSTEYRGMFPALVMAKEQPLHKCRT